MGRFTITRPIPAEPDLVFSTLADFEHVADHVGSIERIEMLTEGPVAPGTRFRETRRIFGKEATEEMTITELDRSARHYAVECESCGTHYRTDVRCTPEGAGTEVSMETSYRPVSMLAKIMVPVGWMMIGTMRKCIERDLDDLERHLGSSASAPPQPAV